MGARRPSAPREIALGLAVLAVYLVVVALGGPPRVAAAAVHGEDLLRLERWLHVDLELTLNHWLAERGLLTTVANYWYALAYVLSAFGLLLYLYLRRPDVYRWARTAFVVLTLIGVTVFALYPVMPPRLLDPAHGFVDTVLAGRTWGSWGSPMIGHPDTFAAMPSMHVAWTLWVFVVLHQMRARGWVQALAAANALLTTFVIVATANHYLLDAVAAVVLVAVGVAVADRLSPFTAPAGPEVVAGTDTFYLHASTPAAPQVVGGAVVLEPAADGSLPPIEDVRAVARGAAEAVPRFRQRLVTRGRWRRPVWEPVDTAAMDWSWHVPEIVIGEPGGPATYDEAVAMLAVGDLPFDRPLWRLAVIRGRAGDVSGVVLVAHHTIADGFGTVASAMALLTPRVDLAGALPDPPDPGRARRWLATLAGVAQLATDGWAHGQLPGSSTPARDFRRVDLDLEDVRRAARDRGVRVTDLLLCALASATAGLPGHLRRLRANVPVVVRDPRDGLLGNVTGAVLVSLDLPDTAGRVPVRAADAQELLTAAHDATRGLRTPTRALASQLVMRVAGHLPVPLHRGFARTFYGRRTFHAVLSNMPGPQQALSLAGRPLLAAYPVVPLAEGSPVCLGALGWNGRLCVSLLTDPGRVPDADAFAAAVRDTLTALLQPSRGSVPVVIIRDDAKPVAPG